jgi:hypothetical protein
MLDEGRFLTMANPHVSRPDLLADGPRRRLKAAAAELIAAMGGGADVAALTGYSAGAVSCWANLDRPDMMPLTVAAALEMRLGRPVLARVLADLTGHALAGPCDCDDGAAARPSPLSLLAGMTAAAGEFQGAFAAAHADGRVTPAEARALDAQRAALQAALDGIGRDIAADLTPVRPVTGRA